MTKHINSKHKGNAGELEFANLLKKYGYEARRSQQYAGGTEESADVIGLPGIYIEVKRYKKITPNMLREFIKKAIADYAKAAPSTLTLPIVAFREDRKEWFIAMEISDMIMFCLEDKTIMPRSKELYFVTISFTDWIKLYSKYRGKVNG